MNKSYTKQHGYTSFAFGVFLYLLVQLVLGGLLSTTKTGSVIYCVIYACLSGSILFIAWLFSNVSQSDFVVCTKANVKPKFSHCLWGCVATLGLIHLMLPINELFLDLIEKVGLSRPYVELDMPIVAIVIITVIIAPIGEEFLFRGTVGNGLVQQNPLKGILLSGALFALFHLNPAQTLHQFVLGSLLMLLAYRSGSVWTSVIVHSFNNLAVVVLGYTLEPTGFYEKYPLLIAIVGGVVFAGGVIGYLFTTKSVTNQTESQQHVEKPNKIAFYSAIAVCVTLWVIKLLSE